MGSDINQIKQDLQAVKDKIYEVMSILDVEYVAIVD